MADGIGEPFKAIVMRHFTLSEFTRSDAAEKNKVDNTPTPEIVKNIECLVATILDPLREAVGHPIIINSGYRCRRLNSILLGSRNSAHIHGLAADFTFRDNTYLLDWAWCLLKSVNHPYRQYIDQCIYYKDHNFIHVGLPIKDRPRNQFWME